MKVCHHLRPLTFPPIAWPCLVGVLATGSLCLGATRLLAASDAQTVAARPLQQQPGPIAARSLTPQLPVGLGPGLSAQAPAAVGPTQPRPSAPAGSMVTIESDSQQADNRSGVITAIGNVRITYPERGMVATSRQAQYFSREGRLVLSGDVDVIDGDGQRIRAERLVYRLDSERLVALPTQGRQVYSRLRLQSQPGSPAPTLLP